MDLYFFDEFIINWIHWGLSAIFHLEFFLLLMYADGSVSGYNRIALLRHKNLLKK